MGKVAGNATNYYKMRTVFIATLIEVCALYFCAGTDNSPVAKKLKHSVL
jgi:hypothetical protein